MLTLECMMHCSTCVSLAEILRAAAHLSDVFCALQHKHMHPGNSQQQFQKKQDHILLQLLIGSGYGGTGACLHSYK